MSVCANCGQANPDEARFCLACGRPLQPAEPLREVRKIVTVLFSDVTGSTSLGERLDPESLRHLMARYFDEMKAALEAHGGTVEKFIGDAVMAVFGIPVLHEDDALRAVRAALEMRERLQRLNDELQRDRSVTILIRTGINTGEVVAGDPNTSQTLVTGDAVNVAARLEQSAQPGEVLIGETTYRLLRDAVEAEPLQPLTLKGKEEPVTAFRLLRVRPDAEAVRRRIDSPMVGRERQLALLSQTFGAAVEDRACHLFTVIGSPGVGKSRLVQEFVAQIADRATVLRGRCLPYGEGITYWPVAEIVKEAAGIIDDDLADDAAAKLQARLPAEEGDAVSDRLLQAMGLREAGAPAEEIAWAFRKFLEALASHDPVVAVFDDIQWAESTLLDLLDHVADWSRDSPILLVCIARQELLDVRPAWSGGKRHATTIQLEPLSEQECELLVENVLGVALLPEVAKSRIAEAAEGNPLFVEQVLSMLIDDELLRRDNGHWVPTADLATIPIPPTIHSLLAARLDRLGGEERQVIERAAVVGKVFYQSAVSELAPQPLRQDVGSHLMTLVRKELIRPDHSDFVRETAFRFRHMLIRDAAYNGMSKETRAELHEAFAAWLERVAGERVAEYDEIIGYHLEQAYRYRVELGTVDAAVRPLAARAAAHLAAAGRRAKNRADLSAAVGLISRSADLLPVEDPTRREVLVVLGESLIDRGEYGRADPMMQEVIRGARAAGDRSLELRAQILQAARTDSLVPMEDRAAIAQEAIPVFEEIGDELGLYYARDLMASVMWTHGHSAETEQELRRLIGHARRVGAGQARLLHWMSGTLVWGPTPAEEGLRRSEELLVEARGSPFAEGSILSGRGVLEAMVGRADDARASGARGRALLGELGQGVLSTMSGAARSGLMEEILGDLDRAEAVMRPAVEILFGLGEKSFVSTLAQGLARVLAFKGDLDEAEEFARMGREATPADDWASQVGWRQSLALVLGYRGEFEEAERLAREAVALTEGVDYLYQMAEARQDLARVLRLAGRRGEAVAPLREALALHEAKGNLTTAARIRKELTELGT